MTAIVEPETEWQPPTEPEADTPPPAALVTEPAPTDVVARTSTVTLKPIAIPVRECGCCGAALGRMLPSEIVCPRAERP